MNITQYGNNYHIQFDYNKKIVAAIKKIPGKRWNPETQVWTVPTSEKDKVEKLIALYNKTNDPKEQPEYVGVIPPMPELTQEIPLRLCPFPYQASGIAYCLQKKRCIIGDQPGLGKTLQAIGVAVATNRKCILVICPNSLKENWSNEFKAVAGWQSIILRDKVKHTWHTFNTVMGTRVFICNYESLKKYFVEKIVRDIDPETGEQKPLRLNNIHFKASIDRFDMVIIDELHNLKDGGTQASKFAMGIARGKEYILGLTGTAIVNKPKDLVAQLHILGRLGDFGGYKYFTERYCSGKSGASNLRELNYMLNITCFYQRLKKDVLTQLPDKIRQIIKVEITNREEYDFALHNLEAYLAKFKGKTADEIDQSMRGEIMVQIGELKRISARGKIDAAQEYISEVVASDEKTGIFVTHYDVINELKRAFPDALTITGKDTLEEREAAKYAFQHDSSKKVILLSIKAAGVGLTLTAASRCLFIELPWHPANAEQCEDRFHRIGQKDSVNCAYLIGENTIDEWNYEIIEKKRDISVQALGSDDSIQTEIINKLLKL